MKFIYCLAFFLPVLAVAQNEPTKYWEDKFKQLGPELATPNEQRTASGAPGNAYWQQRADYVMNITIDDATQTLFGEETITYYNRGDCCPYRMNGGTLQLLDASSKVFASKTMTGDMIITYAF